MHEKRRTQLSQAQKLSREKKKSNNKKQISFYLDNKELKKLKNICEKNNLTYSDFIERAVANEQLLAPIQLQLDEESITCPSQQSAKLKKLYRIFGLDKKASIDELEKHLIKLFCNGVTLKLEEKSYKEATEADVLILENAWAELLNFMFICNSDDDEAELLKSYPVTIAGITKAVIDWHSSGEK